MVNQKEFIAPKFIKIISDGNEIELQNEVKGKSVKEKMFTYKFIKSETKLNLEFQISEPNLTKALRNTFVEI